MRHLRTEPPWPGLISVAKTAPKLGLPTNVLRTVAVAEGCRESRRAYRATRPKTGGTRQNPGNDQARSKVRRNKVGSVANDEKSPTFVGGAESKRQGRTQDVSGAGGRASALEQHPKKMAPEGASLKENEVLR
jgi:hypothetical protein